MEFLEKLKEQEVVDFKLIIAAAVLLVVGLGVFAWSQMGGSSEIADTEHTYHCHFDDAKVNVTNADFYKWRARGDAIMYDRATEFPAHVRCPECNRMSCFKLDAETGEEIEVNPDWDLSESATEPQRGGTQR